MKTIEDFSEYPGSELEPDADLLSSTLLIFVATRMDGDLLKMLGPELQYFLTERQFAFAYLANAVEHAADLSITEAGALIRSAHGDVEWTFPEYDDKNREIKAFAAFCLVQQILEEAALRETAPGKEPQVLKNLIAESQTALYSYPGDVSQLTPPVALRMIEVECFQSLAAHQSIELVLASFERANLSMEDSKLPGQSALHLWRRANLFSMVAAIPAVVETLLSANFELTIRSIPLEARIADDLITTLVHTSNYKRAVEFVERVSGDVREFDHALDAHLHYLSGFSLVNLERFDEALDELKSGLEKHEAIGSVEPATSVSGQQF